VDGDDAGGGDFAFCCRGGGVGQTTVDLVEVLTPPFFPIATADKATMAPDSDNTAAGGIKM
jgi:hypothetical protein